MGFRNKLDFANVENLSEKIIKIQRFMFGTDLWFTGFGMGIHEL